MPEIHGIARVAVRAFGHDGFRRHLKAWATAAIRHAVSSHEPLLQIAPNDQNRAGGVDGERVTMQAQLKRNDRNRVDDKGPVGRSLVPAPYLPPRQSHRHSHRYPSAFAGSADGLRWPLTSVPACGDRLRNPGSASAPTSATAAKAMRKSNAESASSPAPRKRRDACSATLPKATPRPNPICWVIFINVVAALRCAGARSTKGSVKRPVNPSERKPPVRIRSTMTAHSGVALDRKPQRAIESVESKPSIVKVARKPNRLRIGVVKGFMAILPMA